MLSYLVLVSAVASHLTGRSHFHALVRPHVFGVCFNCVLGVQLAGKPMLLSLTRVKNAIHLRGNVHDGVRA